MRGKTKKGFTLLELLLTIVLLVFGVVGIMRSLSIGIFADSEVENMATALYLGQQKMEEIKDASSYAGIDSYQSVKTNLGGNFPQFDRSVTVSAGDPKEVSVEVYWPVKGVDQSVNLVTLFSDYDY